jgi:glycosyltransferase involved in cell wall biosynthesis
LEDAVDRPAGLPPAVVQIVGPTDGWVLERLARILARKIPYAEFVPSRPRPNGHAALAYYVNYALYAGPSGLIDVGFFTHLDDSHGFLERARRMDGCVCMAKIYGDWLRQRGVRDVVHIPMGFDSYHYRPSLVLGVIGKLDHPRKGRHLVERVRQLPFVEVIATEGGWPEHRLRELYQRVDYVLITSLVEGGPMCLLEGLAMGKPVIAPDSVGMVPEFGPDAPIVRYPAGDADALALAVTTCYRQKLRLAQAVAGRSWDQWAEDHHRLFRQLLLARGLPVPTPDPRFRFGLMREVPLPPESEHRGLEQTLDQCGQYLFYGRSQEAEAALHQVVRHHPSVEDLIKRIAP